MRGDLMENSKKLKIKASAALVIMGMGLSFVVSKKASSYIPYEDSYLYITNDNGNYTVHRKGMVEVNYPLKDYNHDSVIDGGDIQDFCNTTTATSEDGPVTVIEVKYVSPGAMVNLLNGETGRNYSYRTFKGYSNRQIDVCRIETDTTLASCDTNSALLHSEMTYSYNDNTLLYKESKRHPIHTESGIIDVSTANLTSAELANIHFENVNFDEMTINYIPVLQMIKKR